MATKRSSRLSRPHVTCHMMSSLDGRIRQDNWALRGAASLFEDTAAKIKVDAWVVGRTTMEEFSSNRKHPQRSGKFAVPPGDFVAKRAKTYCVAIDPKGKCRWDTDHVSTEHVIEALTERVSAEYLDHLRSRGVSYVFGGKRELDLALVLHKLHTLFEIERVRLDGGGHSNGGFLKAGLVDELSLVMAPVVDGRIGEPGIFEVDHGERGRVATHFELDSVKKLPGGVVWMRYTARPRSPRA